MVVRSDKTASAVAYDVVAMRFTRRKEKIAAAATVKYVEKNSNLVLIYL